MTEKLKSEELNTRRVRMQQLLAKYQKRVLHNQETSFDYYDSDIPFAQRVAFEMMLDCVEAQDAINKLYNPTE